MIWVLVVTFILTDASGFPASTEGHLTAFLSEKNCEQIRAELQKSYKKNPIPNRVLSVSCAQVKLPANA